MSISLERQPAILNQRPSLLSLWKEILAALAFSLFLLIFEFNYLNLESRKYFELIVDETGLLRPAFIKIVTVAVIAVVITALFIAASLVSSRKLRAIYFLLFSLITLIEYGYQNATNNFMAVYDLQTALTSLENWQDAISAYVSWLGLVPMGLYLCLLAGLSSAKREGLRLFALVLLVILLVNVGALAYTEFDPIESQLHVFTAGPTLSLPAFFRTVTGVVSEQIFAYQGPREVVPFHSSTRPQNNIIFIVDESVRYDHLSLNGYTRPTTPYLEKLSSEQRLHNWELAVSGSTCSYRSVALLLTGVSTLPDRNYEIKRMPTIFQYAKAMNYKTYMFDGESGSLRFPLTADDLKYVDEWLNQAQLGNDYDTDFRIATQVSNLLKEPTGHFIIIFKRGAHFPYNSNFPVEQASWKPILPGAAVFSENTELMINSYDNSIRYNLDTFFQKLLPHPEFLKNTTILYTSDHGQNFGENGSKSTHCGETRNEAAVPLFMVMQTNRAPDVTYRAGHRNLFATLLDLMDVPEAQRGYNYPVSLLEARAADSEPRYYYHGSLFGIDEYEWIKFD